MVGQIGEQNTSLESINGEKLGHYTLLPQNVSKGRFDQEKNFELYLAKGKNRSQNPVVRGKYFTAS